MTDPTQKWINDAWMKEGLGVHKGVYVPAEALVDLVSERDELRAKLEEADYGEQAVLLAKELHLCRKKAQVLVDALKKMREFNCGCADIPPRVIADKALEECEGK